MFRTLTPIFSIVLAIAIFFFFTRPIFSELRIVQEETSEYQEAVEKAVEFNQLLQTLISKQNSMTARDIERLEALAPTSIDEVKILVDLEEMAHAHNMLIGNIAVSESESISPNSGEVRSIEELAASDISFSLIGTYEQFRALLADIEKSLVRLEIVSLAFDVGDSDLQQYEVTVRTYAVPPMQ